MIKKMRYSNTQIALHWTVAVLVVGQYLFNEPIAQAWNAAANGLPAGTDRPETSGQKTARYHLNR